MSDQKIPIACNLEALPDIEAHHQTGQELMSQAQQIVAMDDGYEIEFPMATLQLAARFVDGERRCCPFLDFKLLVPPGAQTLRLQVDGSAEIKTFLQSELLPSLPAHLRE